MTNFKSQNNSLLDSVGEGEGGMVIWENGIETCKLSYVPRYLVKHYSGHVCEGVSG